ncbi:hypothetical protein Tco_0812075 [Tanacetum coccineum]
MIVFRMGNVKKNRDARMPFAMILTRLYKYILKTNLQSIVPFDRFMYHERVMNPLDISRKTIKDKGKRVAPPSSSSSSSSNEDEEPSFLKFYEELSDDEDLTDAQKDKRGIKKYLSPSHAPSKSTSSKSTYQTTSSSPTESLTPTHVAPPPKLQFVIPIKLESQELLLQQTLPHDPYVSTMDNWPPGLTNPSPPSRVSHPPPRFEHPSPPQPLFVKINNNSPHLKNLQNLPPTLGNQ